MTSGGNIWVRGRVILLLLLPEMLIAPSLCRMVSDETKLMPLSVLTLPPHFGYFRMLESGIDFDVRIDDCVPEGSKVSHG